MTDDSNTSSAEHTRQYWRTVLPDNRQQGLQRTTNSSKLSWASAARSQGPNKPWLCVCLPGAAVSLLPARRMYVEHSFPAARWMGGWKATHLILQMALVWSTLWGFQTLLSKCKALGPIHKRFISLHAGQQRNVSLYLTHLLLDTLVLGYVFQEMIELWFGLTETVAEVRCGVWGFTYLVSCYLLELTWRRSIDTMLAIHHIGTITIIMLYAGELTVSPACLFVGHFSVQGGFHLRQAVLLCIIMPKVHRLKKSPSKQCEWILIARWASLAVGALVTPGPGLAAACSSMQSRKAVLSCIGAAA